MKDSSGIQRVLWRFYYLKATSSNIKVALMVYLAGVASTKWTQMDWDARGTMIIAAIVAVLTNLESLSDQTAAKIAAGKPPIGTNGNTEHSITSEVTAVVTETTKPAEMPKPN